LLTIKSSKIKNKEYLLKAKLPAILLALATVLTIGGCASKSTKIPVTYVSPNEYASLSCATLENEMREISQRVATITGQVDKEASADAWQMGVGLVLFWPALFFLEGGDGALQSNYALLRGKYEAASTQYNRKGCADVTEETVK
jgi:uncharacterized protein YceK